MKARFSPYEWSEITPGEYLTGVGGSVRLRASAPSALYIRCGGYEALVGVDTDFDVSCGDGFEFCLAAPKTVRAFVHWPDPLAVPKAGETYTNPDRQTNESGAVLEVKRALREQQLRQRQFLQEIRAERAAFRALRETSAPEQRSAAPAADGGSDGTESDENAAS